MIFDEDKYLDDLKSYISQNLKDKIYIHNYSYNNKKTQFPMLILSYNSNINNVGALDSSRKTNYVDISIKLEFFTKDQNDIIKEKQCIRLKNDVLSVLEQSDYKGLFKTYDRPIPNLDINICRWQVNLEGTINTNNNGII